ncbi:hypothetical protein BCR33DRAFT_719156 [Rhizoclosmatium globosum]|uniref:E3 ubiquitin-protein ligase listerin n=1 Tax=Rhizoclosmatium globosum TaxID=329046 RepID=A0A1Y2C221_9FUNG|nr:hypothetical protein BCR33DRAFT_719156 [Rhizoclosmatium globosum]|eukprot:ORY41069.1 hypothetical protein BCR33DRAFT_719156 [Rhizoclosmatium globosum]
MSKGLPKGSKAAGASRIADLGSGTPAFGFGAFGGGAANQTLSAASMSSLLPEDIEHLDSELKVLLKRLAKKDALTKIKATDDLKVYLNQANDADLAKFVFIWPKIFNKTALDVERKIRENMIACHSTLFTRLKKEMAPVLKQVIGTWLCLQFDNSANEVAKIATESFQKAFPNKRADVLSFCQSEIHTFVNDNIVYHTVETMSDARYNTPEEMLSKYIRVVSGSLSIISCLYETITPLDNLNITFEQLLDTPKFWETTKSPHAPIRRAFYTLLKTWALLSTASPLADRQTLLKTTFLNECFADKESSTHDALWDAVLSVTQKYPTLWNAEDIKNKKSAPVRLFKFLEGGCYGSGGSSYPALLALLANLPSNFFSEGVEFCDRFFESFWAGVKSVGVTPVIGGVFVKSLQECCLYLVLKYGDSVFNQANNSKFMDVAPRVLGWLVEALLFPALNADAQFKLGKDDLQVAIAGFIAKMCSTSTIPSAYSESLSASLCDAILSSFVLAQRFDGTDLSVDEFTLFCDGASGLITCFSGMEVKSLLLKQKISELSENLVIKSIERISKRDEHFTAASNMFSKLPPTSSPRVTPVISLLAKTSPPFTPLIHSLLTYISISQEDSESLHTTLSKLLSEFDTLVEGLAEAGTGKEVVVKALTVGAVSDIVVTKIFDSFHSELDAFWTSSVDGKVENQEKALFAISILKTLVSKIAVNVDIVARVLMLGTFQFVAGEVSEGALEVWNFYKETQSGNEEFLDVVMEVWKGCLLDENFPGTATDFVLLFERLHDLYSSDLAMEKLLSKALLDTDSWSSLIVPYKQSNSSLAFIESSYLGSEDGGIPNSAETRIENSVVARVACTLAGILGSVSAITESEALCFNIFQLVTFKTLLADTRATNGVHNIKFEDPSDQIDAIVLDILGKRDRTNTWPTDALSALHSNTPGTYSEFKIALSGDYLEGRVYSKIVSSLFDDMSASSRQSVVDLVQACFDSGYYHLAVPLTYAARKYLDADLSDTFITKLCRACMIPKAELSNSKSIEKTVAGISIITNVLYNCKDISSESFALPLKNLVKQFRVWFTTANEVRVDGVIPTLVSQVALFLQCIIDKRAEFDINVAGFVVELTNIMITDFKSSYKPLLFNSLGLYQCLTSADPETWTSLDKFTDDIQKSCLEHFIRECSAEQLNVSSKPQAELQSRLAYLCSEMDFNILFKRLPLDEFSRILFTKNTDAQITTYRLLSKMTFKLVEAISVRLEMRIRSDDDENGSEKYIGEELAKGLSKDLVLMEPDHLIESKQNLHNAFGVLLSWMALLDHFTGATYDLKRYIINELKELDALPKLLDFVFYALGVGYTTKPFDLAGWEFSAIEIEGLDFESEIGISLLCAHIYYRVLRNTPALARTWWSSCKDRQLTLAVETYTDKWFTPLLVQAEIELVLTTGRSLLEDVDVKASKQSREIKAVYNMDEASADMIVRFPAAFPLKPVEFTSSSGGRTIGVEEGKWRGWMMSANILAQNTAILDSLSLCSKNIKLHFEGKEECSICYSVVGVIDQTIPNKSCRTCKNKFHNACLFKWIRTSGNTQCPMCRSEL